MIFRLIERFVPDETIWNRCVEILAALPGNH